MARIGLEWQSGQDKASRGKDLGYRVVGSQLSCTRVDRLGAMGEVPGAPRLCCPGMPSFGYRIDITGSSNTSSLQAGEGTPGSTHCRISSVVVASGKPARLAVPAFRPPNRFHLDGCLPGGLGGGGGHDCSGR